MGKLMKRSEEERRQAMERIRQDSKEFTPFKPLFERRHYEVLKSKTPSLKEAEALYQRQAFKDEALDALTAEIDEVLQTVNSLSIDRKN